MSSEASFAFDPFHLDIRSRQLTRAGEPLVLNARQFIILHELISHAGKVIPKRRLTELGWEDLSVGDNSLEQVISQLRKILDSANPNKYIETAARRGYRFVAPVTRVTARHSDDDLDAIIGSRRAWIDGRAALQTLERAENARAKLLFESLLGEYGHEPLVHVGFATACFLQFEGTRGDLRPDIDLLRLADRHTCEACRLDTTCSEAWATRGLVLERLGKHADALAALREAVALDPKNWRHHFRLSFISWGQERLQAAIAVLRLLPGFPPARWLAASVYVARHALAEAAAELVAGLAALPLEPNTRERNAIVGLNWLLGLLCLARGAEREALEAFERELALEAGDHLYSRECCANTWYAIGAIRLLRGQDAEARNGFMEAIARVPTHAMARVGLSLIERLTNAGGTVLDTLADSASRSMDVALAQAAQLAVVDHDAPAAARLIDAVLAAAPAGNVGWTVPIDPLLGVQQALDVWAPVLVRLRMRAT